MGGRHAFSQSTLLDNCAAIYIANHIDILVEGSFVSAGHYDIVQVRTSQLLIKGYRHRIIKNVLTTKNGPCTDYLVLNKVALVEGFYINIVSETILLEKTKL